MLLAIALLAWVLAHWTWRVLAPAPGAVAPAAPPPPVLNDPAKAAAVFGAAGDEVASVAEMSTLNIRLKGVIAAQANKPASAIVNTGGRDNAVYIGDEIQPGVKLVVVEADRIIIERAGVQEAITIEGLAALTAKVPLTSRGGFALGVAQNANQLSFSRGELDRALKDPQSLSFLGRIGIAPSGGARIDDAPSGSLAQKLGLQTGDVVRKINGQTVGGPGDLARLYQQFASINRIEAEVVRGPATLNLTYNISP